MTRAPSTSAFGTSGKASRKTASNTPMPPGALDKSPAQNEARKMPSTAKKPGLFNSGRAK
jgi:hypothetical protein